jgi:multidrug efflux pump
MSKEQLFSEKLVSQPVLAWVLNIVLFLLGMVAFFQTSVRHYPQVQVPIITVEASYEGAGPDVVETQLVQPLEEAFAGLEGLDYISSTSSEENARVKLAFHTDRSIDAAAADVRDKLSRLESLPHEVPTPRIIKADADSAPVVSLALYGDVHDLSKLYDHTTRYLKSEFESIQGVASVSVYGGATYEMKIVVDPVRLSSFGVTISDVSEALKQQNFNKPAGRLGGGAQEFMVVTKAQLSTIDEFKALVVREHDGQVVRMSDIAEVKLNTEDGRFRVRYNGKNAIMMDILAQSRSNPVYISRQVQKRIEKIQESLPRGMFLDVAADRSVFIEASINQVYKSIWEAVLLVFFVVLFFLRSFKLSLVPLITIPLSLVSTFFIIYLCGFSINVLTLLALVLAVGLVVDDAIVVLENIFRHVENGVSAFKAARIGIREIQFSVIGMTLTLVAVYLPIALAQGMTGKLFTEFAVTLAGSVLISGFVALVLSPMMCANLLKNYSHAKTTGMFAKLDARVTHFLEWAERSYAEKLSQALKKGRLIFATCFAIGIFGYVVGMYWVPAELAPAEDQGSIRVTARPPSGATMKYLDTYGQEIDQALSKIPELSKRILFVQLGDETYAEGTLLPWGQRPMCTAFLPSLKKDLADIVGIQAHARCPSRSLGLGGGGQSLAFALLTSFSYEELVGIASKAWQIISEHPNVQFSIWDVPRHMREYHVKLKRDAAASSGVNLQSLAYTLSMLVGGRKVTRFEHNAKLYPVKISMTSSAKRDPNMLKSIMVPGRRGDQSVMLPLEELVEIREEESLPYIARFSGMRAVRFDVDVKKGTSVQHTYAELRQSIRKILPTGFQMAPQGSLRQMLSEQSTMLQIFCLAIIFIFLILAAQFESFSDPFIIMFSVPLALVGGVFALWLAPGGSLNIYSQIGFVTLIGLIAKHGILLVDFANQLIEDGKEANAALIEACQQRLRPILMTTAAMVLGAVPLVLSGGAGCESRRQVGLVIIGGMLVGTFFTLFVVPVAYTLFSRRYRQSPKSAQP